MVQASTHKGLTFVFLRVAAALVFASVICTSENRLVPLNSAFQPRVANLPGVEYLARLGPKRLQHMAQGGYP
eukprot:5696417-Amphidinium_carterae.1